MKRNININKRAEKIVYKLFSNLNETIYFTINGEKIPYRITKVERIGMVSKFHLFIGYTNLVFLDNYKEIYHFYKSDCKREMDFAVSKEFMKEIKKRLNKEIDFVEK